MSRRTLINGTDLMQEEDLRRIREGQISAQALGFSRMIIDERVNMILMRAFAAYRDETLTAERALTLIAQMVGMDDLRLALQNKVQHGRLSEERREQYAKGR